MPHTIEEHQAEAGCQASEVAMEARLNNIGPAKGANKAPKRRGRGISAGRGKTAGRGHKGQRSRSGGGVRPGFEGGQLPLQKRIPTFGFRSRIGQTTAEVRTGELVIAARQGGVVDLAALQAVGVVRKNATRARVFLSGAIPIAVTVRGLAVSKGARAAIEAAGGSVEPGESVARNAARRRGATKSASGTTESPASGEESAR